MALNLQPQSCFTARRTRYPPFSSASSSQSPFSLLAGGNWRFDSKISNSLVYELKRRSRRSAYVIRASGAGGSVGEWWKPKTAPPAVSLSDVVWPSAGAFAAMALLGRLDQLVASKGLSFTVAPLGAVCAVLFTAPNSPAAQKYNMFLAQIGCAAFGVFALSMFGPGWLARSTALAASLAFMIVTGATHPPAASLPLLFIDGVKFHHLNFWYALFPGAAGCLVLCFIQELVTYLKNNYKF